MECINGCYEKDIQACEEIKLIAGLTPSIPYFVLLKRNNQSNVHQVKLVADGDGALIIQEAALPTGYFTTGSFIRVELRAGDDYKTKVPMVFNAVDYNCVLVHLVNIEVAAGDESPSDINVIQ